MKLSDLTEEQTTEVASLLRQLNQTVIANDSYLEEVKLRLVFGGESIVIRCTKNKPQPTFSTEWTCVAEEHREA